MNESTPPRRRRALLWLALPLAILAVTVFLSRARTEVVPRMPITIVAPGATVLGFDGAPLIDGDRLVVPLEDGPWKLGPPGSMHLADTSAEQLAARWLPLVRPKERAAEVWDDHPFVLPQTGTLLDLVPVRLETPTDETRVVVLLIERPTRERPRVLSFELRGAAGTLGPPRYDVTTYSVAAQLFGRSPIEWTIDFTPSP